MRTSPTSKVLEIISNLKVLNIALIQRLGGDVTISQSELDRVEKKLRSGFLLAEVFKNKETEEIKINLKEKHDHSQSIN